MIQTLKPVLTQVFDDTLRLSEAITRAKRDRSIKVVADTLVIQLNRLFIQQKKDVLKALTALEKYYPVQEANTLQSSFLSLFDKATIDTSATMYDRLNTAIGNVVRRGGTDISFDLKLKAQFTLKNPLAAKYINDRGAEAIEDIDLSTKLSIKSILFRGVDQGWSYAKVANEIGTRYDQMTGTRSRLIAVTELGNAYSAGSLAAVKTAQLGGLTFEKYWLTSNDDRVSDECKKNQAQGWIDLDDSFTSGDERPLRFPGCRCVLQLRRKDK